MNKLNILFIALVAVLFLGGCAQPEEVVEEEPYVDVIEHAPEIVEPEPDPVPEMSEELIDIIANSDKVKSFEYRYNAPGILDATYWFKGDLSKATYSSMQRHNDFDYYHVYVNTEEKTAYLVCDDKIECKGKKGMAVNYLNFEPPRTPWMIVKSIEYGTISEHTQLDNKDTSVVNFVNSEGNSEKLWVWEYWGMPLKREVFENGAPQTYSYDGLVINGVQDEDVTIANDIELI